MRLLYIDHNFDVTSIGGAFKSSYAIISEFSKNSENKILVLAENTMNISQKNLEIRQLPLILRMPSRKLNYFINLLKFNIYLNFFTILRSIKKFKPDFIIVQRELSLPTILAGFFKKVPVVNIIRDAMWFCPKYIDIRKGFENCDEKVSRNVCWNCINRWRTFRIALLDKPKGSEHSLQAIFSTIYYKINYYITRVYFFLCKLAHLNIVASPLMKKIILKRNGRIQILIRDITPIDDSKFQIKTDKLNKYAIERIENAHKIILFVIPRNEGGSKGYPFVNILLKKLPKEILVVVVGAELKDLSTYSNVLNLSKMPTSNLYYLYRKANITIVPSIYTEAFGRVVLESIINGTPVITSPQCGANYVFRNKPYVKVIPLKTEFWIKEINNLINKPIQIQEKEITCLERRFSPQKCAKGILDILITF
ncbi:MAG: glycosyltransferase [Promethearchaeota archaeon]